MKNSLTRWNHIVEASNHGEKIWVGVDVHIKSYSVAILTEKGLRYSFSTSSDNGALVKQFQDKNIKITCLAYEAGLTGYGLYRACKRAGINAIVAATSRIPRKPTKTAKSDRIDCMKLAEYLANGMLTPVTVPDEKEEAYRAKVRCRSQLTQEITRQKNRIKSLLAYLGIAVPELRCWSLAGRSVLREMELAPDLRTTMDCYLRTLEHFEKERSLLEEELARDNAPKEDVLQSIPGVGVIVSSVFRAEVFDPGRFETEEQLSSYLGLAPVIRQSGASPGYARIIPCGQNKLRGLLIEAAWSLRSKEPWAMEFYNRLYSRSGSSSKAITALARKLAVIMWRLWLEGSVYQPGYGRKQAA